MKQSWSNTPLVARPCVKCGTSFDAKRATAKYCSSLCASRARPKRAHDPEAAARRRIGRLAREGYKERINEQARRRKAKVNDFLRQHKLSVGCEDCGFKKHHAALEFHHEGDDKEINLSFAKSLAQARKEMRKCTVLCSNCHRIRHWGGARED